MMQQEFERMVGREVTHEQYKMIEELYMQSSLNKQDFVKSIKTMVKSLPKPKKNNPIYTMAVSDNSGYYTTPNGCYIHTVKVELLDVSVSTGKIKVRVIPDSYELGYHADFYDYEDKVVVVD